jgi:hypothetical protein
LSSAGADKSVEGPPSHVSAACIAEAESAARGAIPADPRGAQATLSTKSWQRKQRGAASGGPGSGDATPVPSFAVGLTYDGRPALALVFGLSGSAPAAGKGVVVVVAAGTCAKLAVVQL